MPITTGKIKNFIHTFIRQEGIDPKIASGNFQRTGPAAEFNNRATAQSEACALMFYKGKAITSLFRQLQDNYAQLKGKNINLQAALGEHGWLAPYLPVAGTYMLDYVVRLHTHNYLYSDGGEIYLQSMAVLMLAYHSDPKLWETFRTNGSSLKEHSLLLGAWLEALLVINASNDPKFSSRIDNWHEYPFHSTERSLNIMQHSARGFYYNTLHQMDTMKNSFAYAYSEKELKAWQDMSDVLSKVICDYEKLCSYAFVDAVHRLEYIQQNQKMFMTTTPLNDNTPTSQEEHSEMLDMGMDFVDQHLSGFTAVLDSFAKFIRTAAEAAAEAEAAKEKAKTTTAESNNEEEYDARAVCVLQ